MSPSDLNTCGEFNPRNQKRTKKDQIINGY